MQLVVVDKWKRSEAKEEKSSAKRRRGAKGGRDVLERTVGSEADRRQKRKGCGCGCPFIRGVWSGSLSVNVFRFFSMGKRVSPRLGGLEPGITSKNCCHQTIQEEIELAQHP